MLIFFYLKCVIVNVIYVVCKIGRKMAKLYENEAVCGIVEEKGILKS